MFSLLHINNNFSHIRVQHIWSEANTCAEVTAAVDIIFGVTGDPFYLDSLYLQREMYSE